MKAEPFESVEGWRVRLEIENITLESRAYTDRLCAKAAADQTLEIYAKADQMGYASAEDFLIKLECWFGYERRLRPLRGETMSDESHVETEHKVTGDKDPGNANKIALKLKIKEENVIVTQMFQQADAFTIYNQEGLDLVGRILIDVKTRWQHIEAERKKTIEPLSEEVKKHKKEIDTYNKLFKEPLDHYARLEALLKNKIVEAQQRAKRTQDEAMAAVQRAHQEGDRNAVAVANHYVQQADISLPRGISVRSGWGFEIYDHALLPRAFLMANEASIRAHVNAHGMQANIPGVRVFEAGVAAVRTS